jgi:peroxiredoxin
VKKGQIVILQAPEAAHLWPSDSRSLIKRIVALGGESYTTCVKAESCDEPVSAENATRTWDIPHGHIFVCGDNERESRDSRDWGPIPRSSIRGIVRRRLPTKAVDNALSRREIHHASLLQGQEAPAFALPTIHGERFVLQQARGQKIVLFFIAYHSLARQELPTFLKQAQHILEKGIGFVIVCNESVEKARQMAMDLSITVPVLVAPSNQSSVYADYHITSTPFYYLIDEQGNVEQGVCPHQFSPEWRALCWDGRTSPPEMV